MHNLGPFPVMPKNNRFLLTVMDHLTRYAEAIPIPNTTAQECALPYATHIIARQGAGSKFLTDHGRKFISAFFRESCKFLGIKQLFTTAYNPQQTSIWRSGTVPFVRDYRIM
jgi:transposase InsO family protein